tara:strand:+ start:3877 stop:5277 length:1401 start_codon:yes stop_codon:yes gene_type:complete
MTLFLNDLDTGLDKIKKKNLKICVVGVGTVGLPLATFLANTGFEVIGLDVRKERVDKINSATVRFEYPDRLKDAVKTKKLKATIDVKEALEGTDVIFICVPTPLDDEKAIDVSNLEDVTNRISPFVKKGMVLVVESSVSIGTTRTMGDLLETKSDLKLGVDVGLAYCPERYNPSLPPPDNPPKVVYDDKPSDSQNLTLSGISRVVGGIDDKSRKLTKAIYSQIVNVDVKEVSSIEAAEATKLTENIFRDVNIALVNELAQVYAKFGLNAYEIIDAAKTKPFAFMAHYPGAGVGGECIPVDTWYLIKQAEKIGFDTKLLRQAREVNDYMPQHMIELLEDELNKQKISISSSKIAILGLAYKKNIYDYRLSATFPIIEILTKKGASFAVCDPLINSVENQKFQLTSLSDVFVDSDAILLVTDHDIFSNLELAKIKNEMKHAIIIDGRNFFNEEEVTSLGFTYRAIGKP